LKMMSALINGCISTVMEKLAVHANTDGEFNIYLYYKRLTMDVICKCILTTSSRSKQRLRMMEILCSLDFELFLPRNYIRICPRTFLHTW
jgi:hypothetical protein